MGISFEIEPGTRPEDRRVEIVERKGLGHPDSVCDAIAEAFSLELSRFYLDRFDRILHHNVDKALLAAGASRPRFGGGEVVQPMRLLIAGRATDTHEGVPTPIAELAEQTATRWLAQNLRALDPRRHVRVESLVRRGSAELCALYDAAAGRRSVLANDTSCGVGYAPLSDLERVVLEVERTLNSAAAHEAQPALGEDVKVMAIRHDEQIRITVSCAMIDRALADLADYAKARDAAAELALDGARRATSLPVAVEVNAADDVDAGRVYLTVTGTSAEAGDDGQTGRGNRVNGLITPGRPMTIESVAGKNPVTHVGKLYNVTASAIATRLVADLDDVSSAACQLVSRIGHPIEEPQLVAIQLAGAASERLAAIREAVEPIVESELARLPDLLDDFVAGNVRIDRWPLWR